MFELIFFRNRGLVNQNIIHIIHIPPDTTADRITHQSQNSEFTWSSSSVIWTLATARVIECLCNPLFLISLGVSQRAPFTSGLVSIWSYGYCIKSLSWSHMTRDDVSTICHMTTYFWQIEFFWPWAIKELGYTRTFSGHLFFMASVVHFFWWT